MTIEEHYIESVKKQLSYYKLLGEKTFNQLEEDQLFWKPNEESNSIAILVQHLNGNMLSRFTNFLSEDGEKKWRNRDEEFDDIIKSKEDLMLKWEEGWTCVFKAVDQITKENFDTIIYVRNIGHSIIEAINRQLMHYAYHIGQIVFIGKVIATNWTYLSIPKGQTKSYNQEKFEKPKQLGHFTDEFLDG